VTHAIWSDHTDIRPTILLLAGLTDDYVSDGRVLVEALHRDALPDSLEDQLWLFRLLGQAYKQINAPVGAFGRDTLAASTKALAGDDATYADLEAKIADLGARRDKVAAKIIERLDAAAFKGARLHVASSLELVEDAEELLEDARDLAH
jgi:hypothetical protein